jgi:hypothetical protein
VDIFLSYARPDRPRAESVAERLRRTGNNVWLDGGQIGQQGWWDYILLQLRLCDVAIALISGASLRSQHCISQRKYAASLGKVIIPLAIEPVSAESLPLDLARLQVIDYCNPNEAAAYQLIGALMQLPAARQLPDPLPEPPPLPVSPMDAIAAELEAVSLSEGRQLAIIGRLESALDPSADPGGRAEARALLDQMARRPDLLAAVDRRIATLQGTTRGADGPPRPRSAPSFGSGPASGRNGAGVSAAPGHPGQQPPPGPWPAAPPQYAGPVQQGAAGTITPHWAMAIVALVLFFPLGIPAAVYASRTRTRLGLHDLPGAEKTAKLVKIFFWITIGIYVLAALSRL